MAEEGQVIACHTMKSWNEQLQKGNGSPILADFAGKMPEVTFLKVDVDEIKSVARDWAVEALPTFVFLKEGSIVDRVVGATKDLLEQALAKHGTAVA